MVAMVTVQGHGRRRPTVVAKFWPLEWLGPAGPTEPALGPTEPQSSAVEPQVLKGRHRPSTEAQRKKAVCNMAVDFWCTWANCTG